MDPDKQYTSTSGRFNYGIGGQVIEESVREAMVDLPQNRTLISGQFTSDLPVSPEIVHDLYTIQDVFNYFKPAVSVELATNTGNVVAEYFSFYSITDFSRKAITNQNNFLKNQNDEIFEYENIIKQVKTNSFLKKCVEASVTKAALIDVLSTLHQEIESHNTIDFEKEIGSNIFKLEDLGGFNFLESIIEELKNLNPQKKALRKIYLSEMDQKPNRELLKFKLKLWVEIIGNENLTDIVESATLKHEAASKLLKKNLSKVMDAVLAFECIYRAISLFFKNTENDKVKNVSFVNAGLEQLTDLASPRFIDAIEEELRQNFRRLDLRNNYSILILIGYLSSKKIIEKWAKIAYENKVMLVTDFDNVESAEEVFDEFDEQTISGAEIYLSNVCMTCNWLLVRGRDSKIEESEDLYIPPSAAFGGKLYNTLLSQVAAGKKHGGLSDIDSVKFDLKKSEIAALEKIGVIPMVNEYGKVMAFSNSTLYNGDNLGLRSVSIVRTFDYIVKVLVGFLHIRAFENFTTKTERDFRREIVNFLDGRVGPNRLIEKFGILRFERNEMDKYGLHLDIAMVPYFPAKNFVIKLIFQMNRDGDEVQWLTEYAMG